MTIQTVRFGQMEVDESKIITFVEGVPGLEEYSKYTILQLEEKNPILWLQSVEDSGVCLPVISSFDLEPGYAFNLADEDVAALKLESPEQLHVLSVLVIPENLHGMTVNMAAPIIINTKTAMAKQIILSGGEYNVRAPAFVRICQMIKEDESNAGAVEKD